MNIDRKMVSLFFEIKRNMPYEQREDMKIAANDLGAKLVGIHQESQNESLNMLIEQFMERAGPEWAKKLDKSALPIMGFGLNEPTQTKPKKNVLKEKGPKQKVLNQQKPKTKRARPDAR